MRFRVSSSSRLAGPTSLDPAESARSISAARTRAHTQGRIRGKGGGGWGSAGPRGDEGEADAEETFIPVELAGTTTGQIQIC